LSPALHSQAPVHEFFGLRGRGAEERRVGTCSLCGAGCVRVARCDDFMESTPEFVTGFFPQDLRIGRDVSQFLRNLTRHFQRDLAGEITSGARIWPFNCAIDKEVTRMYFIARSLLLGITITAALFAFGVFPVPAAGIAVSLFLAFLFLFGVSIFTGPHHLSFRSHHHRH
jgi:hypothetical protein